MAKWDLSKLPEGRKPLPDEWFAERAQMQEWMEAAQRDAKEAEAYAEELEANLAKAVEWFDEIRQHCANFGRGVPAIDERIVERCEDTAASALAELTGGKDE